LAAKAPAGYDLSIFINCPFDTEYKPIFDAIVFAVMECGFIPRCALEAVDAGQVRIEKICQIIASCGFGIHDISRTELDSVNRLPRFNMPLELGLFLGCQRFGERHHKNKSCLILDREQYRYQKFISDIAGQGIAAHASEPANVIKKVRNWLAPHKTPLPGGAAIVRRYLAFQKALPKVCQQLDLQPDELEFNDLVNVIKQAS
jgi:hypothetical protein